MMINAWKTVVLERYAEFSGRAGRAEYWWYFLANVLLYLALFILASVAEVFQFVYFIAVIALIVPTIAVGVRRLHDTGRSGWWYLIIVVPFVGGIVLLVLFILEGDRDANQYGVTAASP